MKNQLKGLLRKFFEISQHMGFDFLPRHFYSSIPDMRELKKEDYWKQPLSMHGVLVDSKEEQINFLKECAADVEPANLSNTYIYDAATKRSSEIGYGVIEADCLYAIIKKIKPKKVIQVGCGVSTANILNASEKAGYDIEVVCIEPYPSTFLQEMHDTGKIKLVKEKAQKVDLDIMTSLEDGDMLFIDSTHTVKVGSEVNKVIMEVLPRLKKGVYVHFHDIYFPYEYQRNILDDNLFFWNETVLLYSFLLNNPKYKIKACMSQLHYQATEELQNIFPNYVPQSNNEGLTEGSRAGKHFPSAIYLQTIN